MYCTKCGGEIPNEVAYCTKCGAKVERNPNTNLGYSPDTANMRGQLNPGKMNYIRIISSAIVFLSTFMPYISAFWYSKSLVDGGDGFFFIGLTIATIVLDIIRKSTPAFVLSIITLAFTVYEVIDTINISSQANGLLNYEIGFFLLIIGSIGMVVAEPIMKAIKKR